MVSAPLIAVVQHQDECPAALLGDWLAEAGARTVAVRPDLGAKLPDSTAIDGLVVLGGIMGATDDAVAPWLPDVRALIRACAEHAVPTLGVCLGHQLAAVALSGRVVRNPRGKQRGILPIGYRADAGDDPLFGALGRSARGVHSNNDVVAELPPDAVVLAEAPTGEVQAARFAPTVWGVQWHPEVDAEVFAGWCAIEPPAGQDEARAAIADVAAARSELETAWRPLAGRFAELCRAPVALATSDPG